MKGILMKDLYIARSNILVTIVSLVVLGFGLSFLLETRAALGLVSQGQLFMLDKGGFQGVTPAEFREFIAQRCPLQKKLSFKKPE